MDWLTSIVVEWVASLVDWLTSIVVEWLTIIVHSVILVIVWILGIVVILGILVVICYLLVLLVRRVFRREPTSLDEEDSCRTYGNGSTPTRSRSSDGPRQLHRGAEPHCPRCGAAMVLRQNRTNGGWFWGCPNHYGITQPLDA